MILQSQFIHLTNASTGYVVGTSGIILKTTDGGTDFIEQHSSSQPTFSFYPNPAKDKITIEISGVLNEGDFSISNLEGQEVIKQKISNYKTLIDISLLPAGVYFVRVMGERMVEMGKIIKQ